MQQLLRPESRPRCRLKLERGWARTGLETSAAAGLGHLPREPLLVTTSIEPWETTPPTVHIHTGLVRAVPRDAPPEERRRAAEETLSQLPPADVTAFTDGSAAAVTENGGAEVVIWSRGRKESRVKTAAGRFTTSYFAELHALNEACKYLEGIASPASDPIRCVRICSDSQSALRSLAEGPAQQTEKLPDEIWTRLRTIGQLYRVDIGTVGAWPVATQASR